MDILRQRARKLRNSATAAERHLWQHLRLKQLDGLKFRRQVPVTSYIADFLCHELKLIVELDGGQHIEQAAYDKERTLALEAEGYRVLRYWNDDVLLQTSYVLEDILRVLKLMQSNSKIKGTPPQSSPALRAREEADSNSNHA
ncbi:MAG: endonuclease domain-containing protein [Pseudoxanthomonas sp.]